MPSARKAPRMQPATAAVILRICGARHAAAHARVRRGSERAMSAVACAPIEAQGHIQGAAATRRATHTPAWRWGRAWCSRKLWPR
eukprot:5221964-Prymnesium_polylepis.2